MAPGGRCQTKSSRFAAVVTQDATESFAAGDCLRLNDGSQSILGRQKHDILSHSPAIIQSPYVQVFGLIIEFPTGKKIDCRWRSKVFEILDSPGIPVFLID